MYYYVTPLSLVLSSPKDDLFPVSLPSPLTGLDGALPSATGASTTSKPSPNPSSLWSKLWLVRRLCPLLVFKLGCLCLRLGNGGGTVANSLAAIVDDDDDDAAATAAAVAAVL